MENQENKNSSSLQQALERVSFYRHGKRDRLRKEGGNGIGKEMYDKLCTLGFITDGATIDPETKNCIRVWKTTNKLNLFEEINRKQSEQEIQFLNKHIEFSM